MIYVKDLLVIDINHQRCEVLFLPNDNLSNTSISNYNSRLWLIIFISLLCRKYCKGEIQATISAHTHVLLWAGKNSQGCSLQIQMQQSLHVKSVYIYSSSDHDSVPSTSPAWESLLKLECFFSSTHSFIMPNTWLGSFTVMVPSKKPKLRIAVWSISHTFHSDRPTNYC